jgi:hypothetical protein
MKNTQSAAELRRSWFRGVRREDVDDALNALTWHNEKLAGELAASSELVRDLAERVLAAEGKLQSFHASFEHAGTVLSLAEQRARDTVTEAHRYSTRVDSDAEHRVRAAKAEIVALTQPKPQAPEPEPSPPRLTVADLLALEAEGRLSLEPQRP